eukprot:TRINITY_DN1362_c0_g1_i11.p3 TRINITY_DN1362_c0_g1~~TRINITY_DN1362_c0_g1_i11.p3  ORF type:complete len:204 (+),score=31.56 TRINITY_DN1362_c0_g1_i11:690-1301(+)
MSAVGDRRFPAVTLAEVPSLSVSVSVLSAFEAAADVHDWTVGVHGIIVSFESGNRSYRATYLPEVMGGYGGGTRATRSPLRSARRGGAAAQTTGFGGACGCGGTRAPRWRSPMAYTRAGGGRRGRHLPVTAAGVTVGRQGEWRQPGGPGSFDGWCQRMPLYDTHLRHGGCCTLFAFFVGLALFVSHARVFCVLSVVAVELLWG